jgi:hypothetical protein
MDVIIFMVVTVGVSLVVFFVFRLFGAKPKPDSV